jgi:uncharacterized protein YodC (DUF2158 family)
MPVEKFKEGDVVRHKTGGPVMQIAHESVPAFYCDWHDADGKEYMNLFSMIELEKVED